MTTGSPHPRGPRGQADRKPAAQQSEALRKRSTQAHSVQSHLRPVADDLAEQHERRFRQLMTLFFVLTLILGALIPWIKLPEPPREAVQKLPPHLAKVIIKKREPKSEPKSEPKPVEKPLAKVIEAEPPKPEPKEAAKPKPEPKPEPKPKPAPKPEPKVEKKPPVKKPDAKVQPTVAQAREKAASSGVFAAQDVLADMRKTLNRSQVGAKPRPLSTNGQRAAQSEDAALSARASRTSGGPQTPVMMRMSAPESDLKKSDAVVESVAQVEAPVVQAAAAASSKRPNSRNEAAIRKTFDQHKGAIDALYRRALRRDPGLQGKVLVEVVIEPSGAISDCRIIESELKNPALEARLVARIRLINFSAQNVRQQKVQYAFEFVPS